jgi:thiamine monophosphate kinase
LYSITPHTRRQAKRIGVNVKPSKRKGKKLDVYQNGKLVASVGAIGYTDYGTLLAKGQRIEAEKRRKRYKQRHQANRTKRATPGWYADQLLW